jgi:hypothetical protein
VRQGYPAAMPNFHSADWGQGLVYGTFLFRPGSVPWRDVPADLLRAYSNRDLPWAIILCRLSDTQPAPNARQRWVDFFTEFGSDESAAYRYWRDVSYGMYYPSETQVFGFFDIGHTSAELASFAGGRQRQKIAEWGMAAARANGVPSTATPTASWR